MDMKRVAVLCVGIFVLALVPAVVSAQGMLSGLPSFGGIFGSPASSGCGEPAGLGLGPLVGYVGWMTQGRNTGFGAGGGVVRGIYQIDQDYDTSGLWLGAQQSALLSDWLGFMATGWYLFPSNTSSTEVYNNGVLGTRSWDTNSQWWFVDGALVIGRWSGLSAIVGLRYDYYSTQFKDPAIFNTFALSGITDEATATSEGWIPLFGTQVAYTTPTTSLTVRAVGVPVLLGTVKYRETIGGLGPLGSAEFSGTYKSGYFLEVFAEYTRVFGPGGMGIFGRWNTTHGTSDADLSIDGLGANAPFSLGINRNSWTFGGSVSLNFNMPL